MSDNSPVIVLHPTNELPTNANELRSMISSLLDAAVEKFFEGNREKAGKFALKIASNILAGGAVAKSMGGLTPLNGCFEALEQCPVNI